MGKVVSRPFKEDGPSASIQQLTASNDRIAPAIDTRPEAMYDGHKVNIPHNDTTLTTPSRGSLKEEVPYEG